MVAAVIVPTDARELRKSVRGLLMARQSGLHMKTERDSRRRKILSTFVDCGVIATIYDAGDSERPQLTRRAACLDLIHADRLTFGGNIIETGADSYRLAHTKNQHSEL